MSTLKPPANRPEIARAIERQMRNWEFAQHPVRPQPTVRPAVCDFISLSRAVGLPGHDVASALSTALGWPVFDKEILTYMAGDDGYRQRLYESMDERDQSWLQSFLQSFSHDEPHRDDYFHRLRSTALTLARKSSAIFVGRAVDLILPRGIGVRVRLEASREYCEHAYAEDHGVSERTAADQIRQIEQDRARFIRRHFGVEGTGAARYDLVVNMERWNVEQSVQIILAALRIRGGAAAASKQEPGGVGPPAIQV